MANDREDTPKSTWRDRLDGWMRKPMQKPGVDQHAGVLPVEPLAEINGRGTLFLVRQTPTTSLRITETEAVIVTPESPIIHPLPGWNFFSIQVLEELPDEQKPSNIVWSLSLAWAPTEDPQALLHSLLPLISTPAPWPSLVGPLLFLERFVTRPTMITPAIMDSLLFVMAGLTPLFDGTLPIAPIPADADLLSPSNLENTAWSILSDLACWEPGTAPPVAWPDSLAAACALLPLMGRVCWHGEAAPDLALALEELLRMTWSGKPATEQVGLLEALAMVVAWDLEPLATLDGMPIPTQLVLDGFTIPQWLSLWYQVVCSRMPSGPNLPLPIWTWLTDGQITFRPLKSVLEQDAPTETWALQMSQAAVTLCQEATDGIFPPDGLWEIQLPPGLTGALVATGVQWVRLAVTREGCWARPILADGSCGYVLGWQPHIKGGGLPALWIVSLSWQLALEWHVLLAALWRDLCCAGRRELAFPGLPGEPRSPENATTKSRGRQVPTVVLPRPLQEQFGKTPRRVQWGSAPDHDQLEQLRLRRGRHRVRQTVRRLPEGQRTSNEARTRFEQLPLAVRLILLGDVTLPETITYVQEHARGGRGEDDQLEVVKHAQAQGLLAFAALIRADDP